MLDVTDAELGPRAAPVFAASGCEHELDQPREGLVVRAPGDPVCEPAARPVAALDATGGVERR